MLATNKYEGEVMNSSDVAFTLLILILVAGCVGDNYIESNERIEEMHMKKECVK